MSVTIGVAGCCLVLAALTALIQRDGVRLSRVGWIGMFLLVPASLISTWWIGIPSWVAPLILGSGFSVVTVLTRGHPAAAFREGMLEGRIDQVPGRVAYQAWARRPITRRRRIIVQVSTLGAVLVIAAIITLIEYFLA